MSVNRYQPHVLIIPEDDANRQLANGFALEVRYGRRIQVLVEAGGWSHVLDDFMANHELAMRRFPERRVVLLIDFDDVGDRRADVAGRIPSDLRDRVFLLGVRSEPEALKKAGLGTFENIGRLLAIECREARRKVWQHELLRDKAAELDRLDRNVRPFLFDAG